MTAPPSSVRTAACASWTPKVLESQVPIDAPKFASTSGEAAGHPRRLSPTPPDLRLWPRSPRRGDSDWFSLCRQASEDLTPVQTPPTPGKVRSTHDNFEKTNRALIDANDNW